MRRSDMRGQFEGQEMVKVTLVRSLVGSKPTNKSTVLSMGLRRPGRSVVLPNKDAIWGMIYKLGTYVEVSKVEGEKK